MRTALVQAVRQQHGFCCGYCGISEADAGTTLTVDHFRPRSHGGTDDLSNLVYCCHACNEHKGSFWNPDQDDRILHPLQDNLTEHFTEQPDGVLVPLTDTGSFHIVRLQLNRPALIRYRRIRHEERQDRENRAAIVSLLHQVEKALREIEATIERLRSGGE
jgi:uncharacterized protein (TIGR02646 family)